MAQTLKIKYKWNNGNYLMATTSQNNANILQIF